jgi:hypothetical protein
VHHSNLLLCICRAVSCVVCADGGHAVSVRMPAVFRFLVFELLACNTKLSFDINALAVLPDSRIKTFAANTYQYTDTQTDVNALTDSEDDDDVDTEAY